MRSYELVLVIRSSVKEADRKKLLDSMKGWLGKLKLTKEDDMGTKVLAYPIKKETSAAYFSLQLEGENVPADLEKKITANDSIIRHLLLRRK